MSSPLTQGRGLKLSRAEVIKKWVAVAPHAGAWIEIPKFYLSGRRFTSPLTQGRGLKLILVILQVLIVSVAPHAGAWIEMDTQVRLGKDRLESPLTQGRGLKSVSSASSRYVRGSPLTQGRGLKW